MLVRLVADETVLSQRMSCLLIDGLACGTRTSVAVSTGTVRIVFCNIMSEMQHDRSFKMLDLNIELG